MNATRRDEAMNGRLLDGKVVLVTGAGSGIGRETALLCATRGARLALCDVDEPGLAETVQAAQARGAEVLAERVDVSAVSSMVPFADSVHERYDCVDLLVNNAGVGLVAGMLETTLPDWKRLIGINVMGVVHGCHLFVPRMVERAHGGHVVNLASQAGFSANPALGAYSTTKFAVFGYSEALREELKPHGIGVTAVCPGVINTPITTSTPIRGDSADARRERLARLYERRNYGPEKVAEKILRAVQRDLAVAPVTPEAHITYGLTRVAPPAARWVAGRMAALAK
jgi:NAD(P)-dependent dehydrogenase (short-subunit alcohol dehydrogenase family)